MDLVSKVEHKSYSNINNNLLCRRYIVLRQGRNGIQRHAASESKYFTMALIGSLLTQSMQLSGLFIVSYGCECTSEQ